MVLGWAAAAAPVSLAQLKTADEPRLRHHNAVIQTAMNVQHPMAAKVREMDGRWRWWRAINRSGRSAVDENVALLGQSAAELVAATDDVLVNQAVAGRRSV